MMKLVRKYLLGREMKMIGKENITDYLTDVAEILEEQMFYEYDRGVMIILCKPLKEFIVKYDYYENRRIKRAFLAKIKRNVVKK